MLNSQPKSHSEKANVLGPKLNYWVQCCWLAVCKLSLYTQLKVILTQLTCPLCHILRACIRQIDAWAKHIITATAQHYNDAEQYAANVLKSFI